MTQTRVVLDGEGAGAGVDVVEAGVAAVAGVTRVRSVACGSRGVVVVDGADPAAVQSAVEAQKQKLPTSVFATTSPVRDDVVVFSVRAADAFIARDAAQGLLSALRVPGVSNVVVTGGKREKQVLVDMQRLLTKDVTLLEVLHASGGASSLETTIVKSVGGPPKEEAATMMMVKAPTPPPAPGEVRVLLPEVADIGMFPVPSESSRRDGAVEVRVSGEASAKDAILKAARGVKLPDGVELAVLDDDSVERVDLVVANASPAQLDELQRELLAIPGARLTPPSSTLKITVDGAKAKELNVSVSDAMTLAELALEGRVLMRNTENVRLRLKDELSPEGLLSLVVARTPQGPVRLLDVAVVTTEITRTDKLDRKPATRLSVLFDVGVRKNAVQATQQLAEQKQKSGMSVVVEKRDLADCR